MGGDFRGCLDVQGKRLLLPKQTRKDAFGRVEEVLDLSALPTVEDRIAHPALESLALCMDELPTIDPKAFHEGHLSPVIFGSALRNFGVAELLDCLSKWAPGALPRKSNVRTVPALCFKVQANMDLEMLGVTHEDYIWRYIAEFQMNR